MDIENLTRRKVLASLGVAGAASAGGVGGLFVATEPALAMENSTQIEKNDLEVSWTETYNGDQISGGTVNEETNGPRISLSDVKPGDTGTLILQVEIVGNDTTSAQPVFSFELGDVGENGITEPERKAPDEDGDPNSTDPKDVELLDYIQGEIWYDTGMMDVDPLGEQNGTREFSETLIAEGTLDELDGTREETGECLSASDDDDNYVVIAFSWEFTGEGDPAVNATQTDRVMFDIICEAIQCS